MDPGEDIAYDKLQDCKLAVETYLDELNEARSHINASADQSAETVQLAMEKVIQQLVEEVGRRKSELLREISQVKTSALTMADHCGSQAKERLRQMDQLISCTQADDGDDIRQTLLDVAEDLGPELPPLSSLPRLTVHVTTDQVVAAVRQLGQVETTAAVGGVRTEPRPGAILVTWAKDEYDDPDTDGSTYRLQYCYGDAVKLATPVYHLAYEGGDASALVRRLQCDVTYSFRVSRKVSPDAAWGAWSHPVTAATNLAHYRWSASPEYMLSDSGRIACRCGSGSGCGSVPGSGCVFSAGAQLRPGAPLRVLVLEAGAGCSDEGVALLDAGPAAAAAADDGLAAPGALFVSATGEVYVDGRRRQTRLPPLRAGSQVTFTTERRDQQTTRVWLEADDKQVVYDWHAKSADLWLAACFNELGWKLLLE